MECVPGRGTAVRPLLSVGARIIAFGRFAPVGMGLPAFHLQTAAILRQYVPFSRLLIEGLQKIPAIAGG
jgi:hypothetical protein